MSKTILTFRQPDEPTGFVEPQRNKVTNSVYVGGQGYTLVSLSVDSAGETLGLPFSKLTALTTAAAQTYTRVDHEPLSTNTISVFFRKTSTDAFLRISMDGGGVVIVDCKSPEGQPSVCTHVGDDVWRAHLSATAGTTTGGRNAFLRLVGRMNSLDPAPAGMFVEVAGFQFEEGSTATPYQAVRSPTDYDGNGVGTIWLKTDANDNAIARYRYNGATWVEIPFTVYRILPDGRRRALPDGTMRSKSRVGPA